MTQTEVMTQTGQTTATIEHVTQKEEQVTSNEEQDAASFLEMLVESLSGTVSDSLPDSETGSNAQRNEQRNKDALFAQASDAYYASLRDKAVRLQDDPEFNMDDADTRFSTALNLRAVKQASCCIIGAGGLGNWQWRILLSMGFRQVIIYDDDTVGIENVGPQAHSIFDIGLPKVEAVRRAALQYRGLSIVARQKRVMTHAEIVRDIGFVPDIIIGCTDSAEFRNSFIHTLRESVMEHIRNGTGNTVRDKLPQLFIDYRMSLGDWNAYIIPARNMGLSERESFRDASMFFSTYMDEACFQAEDAVREACTERAISYTGASVASFTGALLHWWFSGGRNGLLEDGNMLYKEFLRTGGNTKFTWKMSYSSRDWESVTPTRRELFLERKLAEERGRLNAARDELEASRDELEITRCECEAARGELDLLKARLDAAQRQIDRLSSTQMTAEEPAVENLSSVPEDTVSVPVQVTSQELVAGDRINLGVPNEDYTVLAIGRQLRLKDLATGEEFLCRHFAHPVIRYTEESWAPVEMTNTRGEA